MAKKYIKKYLNKRKLSPRTIETRGEPKQTFLIICEGEKTEPNYFKSFKVKSASIRIVGTGCNTVSLVEETDRLSKRFKKENMKFDQIWCVFDRDSFHSTFNDAVFLAQKLGFNVAYSNEAFELWYLLHYIYFDSDISRNEYIDKLDKYLPRKYKKNDPEIYSILLDAQENAIKHAKRLLENYDLRNPDKDAPATLVHLLVEELNKYL